MSPKTSLRAFEVNAMMQITLNFDKGDVTPVFQQLQQIQVKLQCTGQVDHTGYLTPMTSGLSNNTPRNWRGTWAAQQQGCR
jgi:hypothetical protein